jgi:competence protein ComEC
MNYAEENEIVEKKIKLWKRVALILAIVLLAGACIFSAIVPAETWKYYHSLPKIRARKDGELRMHFLNVGEGDCSIIEFPDGKTLLIDGGDVDGAKSILRYLNALKIDRLDYVLLTHTDTDHCGSLGEIVKYKKIGFVYLPNEQKDKTQTKHLAFESFAKALVEYEIESQIAKRYDGFTSSNENYSYSFDVLFPYSLASGENDELDSNELSVVSILDYKGVTVLFCGDTNQKVLSKLCKEDKLGVFEGKGVALNSVEILKYPHHGAYDGANEEVLSYLGIKTAVISCGKNNYYGHPSQDTLTSLNKINAQVYRTDRHGTVMITVSNTGEYTTDYSVKK